jgi:hypothetical protein
MTPLFQVTKNQGGFSLVQVLIATALAGGLSLVILQISSIQNDVSVRGQSALDEQEALSRFRNILSNPKNCTASLNALAPFRRSQVDSNSSTPGLEIELKRVDYSGNESVAMSASSPHKKFGRFEIQNLKLTFPTGSGNFPTGTTSETGIIEINYLKLHGKSDVDKRFTSEVNILVETQPNGYSKITECAIESQFYSIDDAQVSYSSSSGYVNGFDQVVNYTCPGNRVLTGELSYHTNGTEDRRHSFRCAEVRIDNQALVKRNCQWSGNVNSMDGLLNYQCPNSSVMNGHSSYHDNGTEDRIYNFQCCDLGNSNQKVKLNNCQMLPSGGWINNWDQPVNFTCPAGKVKVGEHSVHSNHYEDRLYRFKCCSVAIEGYQ